MDKRSIIGLLIIGAILFAFSYFQARNAEDQIEKTTDERITQTDSITTPTDTLSVEETNPKVITNWQPVLSEDGLMLADSSGKFLFKDSITGRDTLMFKLPPEEQPVVIAELEEEIISIENERLKLDISTKGGRIVSAFLKDYKTYTTYINEENEALQLFNDESTYGINFFDGNELKNSDQYDFKIVSSTDSEVTVEMLNPSGKIIGYKYTLSANKYDVDFSIYFKGFADQEAQNISLASNFKLLSTEKHLPSEQRVSTVFYKYSDDSYDYLSEVSDDEEELEEKTDWVAYKQSFFSAILMKEDGFSPSNSEIEIKVFEDENQTTYVKEYISTLNLGIKNSNNTVDLKWYFGPNDYDILATYENGSEDIVNLGWGLFRWINVWFMRPIFTSFIGWGLSAGLAILLLTIFVKLLLSPVNYKMYKSSAMMKVLRPEIEKISKKFPKKEDAMKKQQATMALYRETGVSPMAGCIPMLIQMPILFAIFRLFPAEIGLRQQRFLWAEDLSTYDAVLNFGFNIPFYGDHISLFTLLMAGTTLLYTHYNSSNMQQPTMEGIPNMKYIMYFFPIMMIFFFNSYASGLSYYYFISTLMTILIMFAIKRFMLDEDKILAKIEANKANPKKSKGKSKFQQRLEEAQRLQQERQKRKK